MPAPKLLPRSASPVRRAAACAAAAAIAALVATSSARADAVHGIDYAPKLTLDGQPLLLNVAGVMHRRIESADGTSRPAFGALDYDDWARVLTVNVLGQARVAEALVDNVAASEQKKVITLSSELGSVGANSTGGLYAYRSSKAAVNAVMKSMSIDLASRGIIAVPMHPGWVRTDMGGPRAPLSAEESVSGMRRVIAGLTIADSGRFLQWDGKELPW